MIKKRMFVVFVYAAIVMGTFLAFLTSNTTEQNGNTAPLFASPELSEVNK